MLRNIWGKSVPAVLLAALLCLTAAACSAPSAPEPTAVPAAESTAEPVRTAEPADEAGRVRTDAAEGQFYMDDGTEDGSAAFGVIGSANLFDPDSSVTLWFRAGKAHAGETVTVTFTRPDETSDTVEFTAEADGKEHVYTADFETGSLNGIAKASLMLSCGESLSLHVGILPQNERADDSFYFGIQPYITRAYLWGQGFCIPGQNGEETGRSILAAADRLGVNLIREDGAGWQSLQNRVLKTFDFTIQDTITKLVTDDGIRYLWILGNETPDWAVDDSLKGSVDPGDVWRACPDADAWKTYTDAVAAHYANDPMILWEIWNEPNIPNFFIGENEQFFALQETAARSLKGVNPDAEVYSGGLAYANRSTNDVFYAAAAGLIEEGLMDGFGYHNHDPIPAFWDSTRGRKAITDGVGLDESTGINTESGINGSDAAVVARKALLTRALGDRGFVSFSFRSTPQGENDVNRYAFFDDCLQPKKTALAYGTVIRFVGNAELAANVRQEAECCVDLYEADGHSLAVLYNFTGIGNVTLPDAACTVYDMLGNLVGTAGRDVKILGEPLYAVFEGIVSADDFGFEE